MVKLFLFNNLRREEVGQVSLQEIRSEKDIPVALMHRFQKLGCVVQPGRGNLCIRQGNELIPFDEKLLLYDDVTVVYLDIIKPDNVLEFDRKNGISYFFHTSEKGHRGFPHIHARYSDEEISIYFKDFDIIGEYKSKTKQKEAVDFVRDHMKELIREWNRIVQYGD